MADEQQDLDLELAQLGAQWRADNPGPGVRLPLDLTGRSQDEPHARRFAPVALAAAAVLVAVVVGAFLRPDGSEDPQPATQTPSAFDRLDCGRGPQQPVAGDPIVPSGAVAARLCGRSEDDGGFASAWPADTLTGKDAARVAAVLNALRPLGPKGSHPCFASTPYELVLRYADGSRVVARGTACNKLSLDGSSSWAGAATVSDLFLRLVGAQRASVGPRQAPIPAQCPLTWQNLAGTVGARPVSTDDDVAVTACQYRVRERRTGLVIGALDFQTVPTDPSGLLADALAGTQVGCGRTDGAPDPVQRVLLVRDAFGDLHVVSADRCQPNDLAGPRQYPGPALNQRLTELFADRGAP